MSHNIQPSLKGASSYVVDNVVEKGITKEYTKEVIKRGNDRNLREPPSMNQPNGSRGNNVTIKVNHCNRTIIL